MSAPAPRSRAAAPIRLRDVTASEVIKILTLPAAAWALAGAAGANLLLSAIALSGVRFGMEHASLSAYGLAMAAPAYLFALAPAGAAACEYRTEQLRVSLTAVPDRRRLAAAKLAALLAAAAPAALVAVAPGRILLGVHDGAGALALASDVGRWTGVYVLLPLVAFGLAGLARSVAVCLGALVVVALANALGFMQWPEGVRLLPDQLALSALGTPAFEVTALPAPIAACGLLAWGLALTGGALALLVHRDA